MSNYIGLRLFEQQLRKKMSERISQFIEYMGDKFTAEPGSSQNKTKKQWTEEFKRWSESQVMLESMMLEYLKGD